MNTFQAKRNGLGTKEWSDFSYNICRGCEHGCLYCYAKSQFCRTDPRMRLPGQWQRQELNPNRSGLGSEVGHKGVVMFPTSHDIVPRFYSEALRTIRNLSEKNKVLVVSKPHRKIVENLCRELENQRGSVLFRFTIGSLDPKLCAFWEPGAPPPAERLACLEHAFERGFGTSVSIEPMLDDRISTGQLVARVAPYVADTIWIGKMQRIPRKHNAHIPGFSAAAQKIKDQQSDAEILRLVEELSAHPKVRWKDSIKKVLARNNVS